MSGGKDRKRVEECTRIGGVDSEDRGKLKREDEMQMKQRSYCLTLLCNLESLMF